MSSNVKAFVDQYFTILSALSILNINPDDSHVGLRKGIYNSQF